MSKQYDKYKFPYKWNLKDGYPAKGIEQHNSKVFGTFICGGGSSMGYKLAGYEHLGGVEIDPKVADVYKANHNPKHLYVEDIRAFNKRENLPKELYHLDLLDGSPPCSSFSMAGNREKDWGKKKVFREGQAHQVLDDLVFEYIKTIKKLKPKVALLENVKGLIQGNARAYTKKIFKQFKAAGYSVQLFLLNAASMGVPQKRERVFFIGLRNDFDLPKLALRFNEKPVVFGEIKNQAAPTKTLTNIYYKYWKKAKQGESVGKFKTCKKMNDKCVSFTLTTGSPYYHSTIPRGLNTREYCLIGTYPIDYNFKSLKSQYLIGMSVPPLMTAQISHQIYLQWLSKTTTTKTTK